MKKSRTGSFSGEALASPPVATVQLPLRLCDVLTDVRAGFFALCIETGQQVLATLMEYDRQQLCGPKNVPHPARTAYRAGIPAPSPARSDGRCACAPPELRGAPSRRRFRYP